MRGSGEFFAGSRHPAVFESNTPGGIGGLVQRHAGGKGGVHAFDIFRPAFEIITSHKSVPLAVGIVVEAGAGLLPGGDDLAGVELIVCLLGGGGTPRPGIGEPAA